MTSERLSIDVEAVGSVSGLLLLAAQSNEQWPVDQVGETPLPRRSGSELHQQPLSNYAEGACKATPTQTAVASSAVGPSQHSYPERPRLHLV